MTFPVAAVFIFVAFAFLGAVALLRSIRRQHENVPAFEWVESFTISRYAPMKRMLTDEDDAYLSACGVDPAVRRRLRAERRRVFRVYLNNLIRDFHRLHRFARILVLESETDRSELAEHLLRQRFAFEWAVFNVRVRVALHACGLGPVDVTDLIGAAGEVANGVRLLTPIRQTAAF